MKLEAIRTELDAYREYETGVAKSASIEWFVHTTRKLLAVAEAAKAHRDKNVHDECLPVPSKTGTALDKAIIALEADA